MATRRRDMAAMAFGDTEGGNKPPKGDAMADNAEPSEQFTALATRLFPDVDPAELKELIHLCLEEEGY